MQLPLAAEVEDLYAAFDDTPEPNSFDVCPCCVSDEELAPLRTRDRRSLTSEELTPYFFTATGSVTGEDFVHFFPRIVELMFVDGWEVERAVAFGRLGRVEARSLTPRRRSGLTRFMAAAVSAIGQLSDASPADDHSWLIDEVIGCQALSGLAVDPLLERLLEYPRLLASFCAANPEILTSGRQSDPFFGDVAPESQAAIAGWLQSDHVLDLLTDPGHDRI